MSDRAVVFPVSGHKEQRLLAFDSAALAGYEWPYFAISGAQDGPTVALIAGIHGAEYPPIDAALRFCQALDPAMLRGRVLAVPVVDLPSFWERTPFVCPIDGKNPNRVFPGAPNGTFSEALAYHMVESVFRRGDYLVDLHGGDLVEDLVPFSLMQRTDNAALDEAALDLAYTFGLPYVISQAPSGGPVAGTTNGAAAQVGIPALIAEAGGIGQLQPEAVELHLRGLRRVLQRLRMLDGALEPLPEQTRIHDFVWIRAERGGFFRKAIAAGDNLAVGGLIGTMVDLWGETRQQISSPVAGTVLFVTTSPAIKDDGLLVGIGVPA
jgi:predicted deacylase